MASWKTYLLVFVYIALLFFFIPIRIEGPDELEVEFQNYLKNFNKSYDNSSEYQNRLQAFKKALENIELLNSNKTNGSATYGLTKFSDLLPEEFLSNHLHINLTQGLTYTKKHHHHRDKRSLDIPNKVDWREKNVITKIYDQGNCGACWAYSVMETIESVKAIKSNKTEDLSIQEIINCAGNGNDGCKGGDICSLLSWMVQTNYSLHRQHEYSKGSECKPSSNGFMIEDFLCENLVGLENVMLRLLAENGPIAVAINAQTWQNYIGGVIEYHCDGDFTNLNHAVQIVGYDLTSPNPHYIVRNTWGEDFGDKGYLYIAIEKNMCGLANEVAALTVL